MIRNIAFATIAAALLAGTASADTLREALVSTYNANPTIMAQREALKGTDATVAIARAGSRPQVSATAGFNQDLTKTGGGNGRNFSAGVDVSYPLFNGGSVSSQIKAAKTRVEAGRATLRAVEGDVFTEAVAAYMDVIRDRAIVEQGITRLFIGRRVGGFGFQPIADASTPVLPGFERPKAFTF